jgi:hypothetical protein
MSFLQTVSLSAIRHRSMFFEPSTSNPCIIFSIRTYSVSEPTDHPTLAADALSHAVEEATAPEG